VPGFRNTSNRAPAACAVIEKDNRNAFIADNGICEVPASFFSLPKALTLSTKVGQAEVQKWRDDLRYMSEELKKWQRTQD
jgi:hypothetical protein